MSKGTYAERLGAYLEALPNAAKNELLLKVALAVFDESVPAPTIKFATLTKLEAVLASLKPELHAPYDRAALTTALGEYLVEWWGETLKRPLTGKDVDQLLDRLPEYGIREALNKAAEAKADEEAS